MAATNTRKQSVHGTTHEGAPARFVDAEAQLRRTVMACMLWESSFYESGQTIADRMATLIAQVDPAKVADIAIEAREKMKLRHVPLMLCRELARAKKLKAETLARVIQRADEITEFLALYWKEKRQPLSAQVKKGLAMAFHKFDEYALAKYDRQGEGKIRLRDALFLCHAKPENEAQAAIWKRLVENKLETPDTWEVALSAGGDKKETWTRLLKEGKLFALALLRNLRNITEAGVPRPIIAKAMDAMKTERVLPFRFIAAARVVPALEDLIEPAMLRCLEAMPKLPGRTVLLVDTSPSMDAALSAKSDLTRKDAAMGLAILVREVCSEVEIVAFSSEVATCPPRRGFALGDAIRKAVPSDRTLLGNAIRSVSGRYDRIIVITDEQSQDAVGSPDNGKPAYMVNVSVYQNGVAYGPWTQINGWSESILSYIAASEGTPEIAQ